jgi:hypothetical protein
MSVTRKVRRYQRGNQKPYIKEGQTIQRPKELEAQWAHSALRKLNTEPSIAGLFLGNCRYLDNILTIYDSNLHVCKTNLSPGT